MNPTNPGGKKFTSEEIRFSRYAFPIIRRSYYSHYTYISGCGDHSFKGSTDLETIDFEALIPPKDEQNLERWYREAFAKLSIDSSIREQVLLILVEMGYPSAHPARIHARGFVSTQPLLGP